jgi:hypothetical protein
MGHLHYYTNIRNSPRAWSQLAWITQCWSRIDLKFTFNRRFIQPVVKSLSQP